MRKIFLLHGWTYSLDKWQPILRLLKGKGYDITTLAIPGLTAPLDKPWMLDDYVNWLYKIISKEKEKPTLIAHSNGGRISLKFAAKYPKLLEKLILIDSAGIYHNEIPLRLKRFVFKHIAKFGKQFIALEKVRSIFYKFLREQDYKNTPNLFVRQTMINLISTDITPFLPQIQTPTTLIWGENDTITPLSDGKKMQTLISHATLTVIPQAKHAPYVSHPTELAKIVEKQLQTL